MNNPLAVSQGDFRLRSLRNKNQDEKDLIDLRGEYVKNGTNPCSFPKKVYVINRRDREDRWSSFCSLNSSSLENFEVTRWDATVVDEKITSVVDAIFESFLRCLKDAFQTEECVIVMEDDAYIAEGGVQKLKMCWKDLPEDWDVLVGNHYWFYQMNILTDHLAKPVDRASTANFIVVRKTALPKILKNLDLRGIESIRDFDHFITSDQVPINNYSVWPMISREIASFSNHKGKNLDSSMKIKEHSYKYLFIDQEKFYPSLEGW